MHSFDCFSYKKGMKVHLRKEGTRCTRLFSFPPRFPIKTRFFFLVFLIKMLSYWTKIIFLIIWHLFISKYLCIILGTLKGDEPEKSLPVQDSGGESYDDKTDDGWVSETNCEYFFSGSSRQKVENSSLWILFLLFDFSLKKILKNSCVVWSNYTLKDSSSMHTIVFLDLLLFRKWLAKITIFINFKLLLKPVMKKFWKSLKHADQMINCSALFVLSIFIGKALTGFILWGKREIAKDSFKSSVPLFVQSAVQ